jgi:ubiquinone/menaquinone biosynthesis C-methylase UbiE
MADQPLPAISSAKQSREAYSQANNPAFDAQMSARMASREAAFFLPHLRPGMRLLDVGCGPGAITIGLAEIVAPGEVVGLDQRPEPLVAAREVAAQRSVTNIQFEVGSAYDLPFPDGSFDAAFAHIVLMHLREPVRALAEMRRVLRPGGVVGIRDVDFGATMHFPLTPLREQLNALRERMQRHNGGNPFLGRAFRRILLDAGFARAESGASVSAAGSATEIQRVAAFLKAQSEGVRQAALANNWADRATLDAMISEIDLWAERPDAFYLSVSCEAIGWVGA